MFLKTNDPCVVTKMNVTMDENKAYIPLYIIHDPGRFIFIPSKETFLFFSFLFPFESKRRIHVRVIICSVYGNVSALLRTVYKKKGNGLKNGITF